MKNKIRFGVIGAGLMGREFATNAARWHHLKTPGLWPEITAVCDPVPAAAAWFTDNVPSCTQAFTDHRELLASDIDAVYCAVPHHLHAEIYADVIRAGKHLMAEKPFGIDLPACESILAATEERPDVFVRCSSEFPYYPPVQELLRRLANEEFGEIYEIRAAFNHCSDLDPNKPINWKRRIATNGEYGCMGDLGLHVCHVPFRLGIRPKNVRALLSKIVRERPDGHGGMAPCETWDNATLACETEAGFPMLLETKRISPGDTNSWSLAIYGTRQSAEFSTRRPKTLRTLPYTSGDRQAWREEELGQDSAYPVITGHIFESGFSDSILQMWASFMDELAGNVPPFGCALPEEAHLSHRLFTAALRSHANVSVEPV